MDQSEQTESGKSEGSKICLLVRISSIHVLTDINNRKVSVKEQEAIFEKWLSQYKSMIFKIVRAYAWTAMDQDDLFQDIILQVWNSIPTFRNESSASTWIYRISLNTSIKWLRKEKKKVETIESHEYRTHVLVENTAEENERLTWLYKEIYSLDEIDRCITILLLDGLSYREMAEILGITESNVGVKINRIKKLLVTKSKGI